MLFTGLLYLSANELCQKLYHTNDAGKYLQWFSILVPMLYCDAIIDAITKGLGKQKICVAYNIITSMLDVILLFILLPKYGMLGYFISFFISHFLNLILSTRLLMKSVGKLADIRDTIVCVVSGMLLIVLLRNLQRIATFIYTIIYFGILWYMDIINRNDFQWLKGLVRNGNKKTSLSK